MASPTIPMMRYARAFIWGDYAAMVETAPVAVELLRSRGDDYVADMFSVTALAIARVLNGELDEADALLGELVDRFRNEGPPTALQFALTWLGTTASIRAGTRSRCGTTPRPPSSTCPRGPTR